MALVKEAVIDKIEVLESGQIQVRRATWVLEDGVRIAGPIYRRQVYDPEANLQQEDARVQAISAIVWTPEVIAAHRQRQR